MYTTIQRILAIAAATFTYTISSAQPDTDTLNAFNKVRVEAEAGNVESQFILGAIYAQGELASPDYKEALRWWRKASEQGHLEAQSNLGYILMVGKEGVEQDYEEALKWSRRAAEKNSVMAQYNLGEMHRRGLGVEIDYGEAADWYDKAAKQGYAPALYYLGLMYLNGQGVDRSLLDGVRLLEPLADNGDERAAACIEEVLTSEADAYFDEIKKRAQAGEAEAQWEWATILYTGQGPEKRDLPKAAELYLKSAEQGFPKAQYNLGYMLANGEGGPTDFAAAAKWYRKAADAGLPEASSNLGRLYAMGQGVEQNYETAMRLYRYAAMRGYPPAQFNIGAMYANGEGVETDRMKAWPWFYIADAQGHEPAAEPLRALSSSMSEAQFEEVRQTTLKLLEAIKETMLDDHGSGGVPLP